MILWCRSADLRSTLVTTRVGHSCYSKSQVLGVACRNDRPRFAVIACSICVVTTFRSSGVGLVFLNLGTRSSGLPESARPLGQGDLLRNCLRQVLPQWIGASKCNRKLTDASYCSDERQDESIFERQANIADCLATGVRALLSLFSIFTRPLRTIFGESNFFRKKNNVVCSY